MKNYGVGTEKIDRRIQEEASLLVTRISDKAAEPFDPYVDFATTTANIVSPLVFGERWFICL